MTPLRSTPAVPAAPTVLLFLVTASAFTLDLLLPLGVAAGVPYLAAVLLCAASEDPRRTLRVMAVGIVLIVVGAALSSRIETKLWIAVTNRFLAIVAVIGTAAIVAREQLSRRAVADFTRRLDEMRFALDASAIVAATDRGGRITYANDKFCEISGYRRDELIGQNHRIVNSGHHPKAFWKEMWACVISGRVWRDEVCNRAKDGRLYWVDTTVVPLRDAHGEITQFMAVRSDITARRLAEERLVEQTALARVGELAAVVAHEVRNPLAGITGALQVLRRRMSEEATEHRVLGEVLERVSLLNAKLEDLLGYARPNAPKLDSVDLLAVATEVARRVSDDPAAASTQVLHAGQAARVDADREQIEAATLNAALNAVQAGAEVVTIEALKTRTGGRLTVSDDGPGIAQAVRGRAFEPFVTGRRDGTGLGLAIVRNTVESHGGRVTLACPPGGGTVVKMDLPRSGRALTGQRRAIITPRPAAAPEVAPQPDAGASVDSARTRERWVDDGRALLDLALGHVAHEIRNPLTGVRGVLANMSRGRVPEERLGEYLEVAMDSLDRIAAALDDALAGVGLRGDGEGRAPVADAVQACRVDLQPALQACGLSLEVELSDGLPAASAPPERLAHGLATLILHAADTSRSGGSIRVSATDGDDLLRVMVRWSPNGTPPRAGLAGDHPRVAEIGLLPALAERSLQASGARVSNEVEGDGATLTLSLPTA